MNAGVAPAVVGDWLKTFAQKHFLMRTYQNFIGGEWAAAKSGQSYRNVNPADAREVVAEDDMVGGLDFESTGSDRHSPILGSDTFGS